MSEVNANPDDLRRLRRDLVTMRDNVLAATSKTRSTMSGVRWNDRKRRDFEQQLNTVVNQIKQSANNTEGLVKSLDNIIAQLDSYLGR